MIKTALAVVGTGTLLVLGCLTAMFFWPCNGDCRAYWDWMGGAPDPGCYWCKRKDRLKK